jgi:hypothetical protein
MYSMRPELRIIDRVNTLNAIYNPPNSPRFLYHYTNLDGLDGITGSHTIRATYNRVLNDPSEQIHARRVLCEALQKLAPKNFPSLRYVRRTITETSHFIASFCESDQLPHMWRRYAAGGSGCCLEFDYDGMRGVGLPVPPVGVRMPLLARVAYGPVPVWIEAHLRALRNGFLADGSCVAFSVSHLWLFISSMIKNREFETEQEWRIIVVDPPGERVIFPPASSRVLKRYVELAWLHLGRRRGCLPLDRVTYNPAFGAGAETAQRIRSILDKNGYAGVLVEPSSRLARAS